MSTQQTDRAENEGMQPKKRAPRRAASPPKADAVAELSAQVAALMAEVGRLKTELEEARPPEFVEAPEPQAVAVDDEPLPPAEPSVMEVETPTPSVLEWDEAAPDDEPVVEPEGLSAMIPPPESAPPTDDQQGLLDPDEIAALLASAAAAPPTDSEQTPAPSACPNDIPVVAAAPTEGQGAMLDQNEIASLLASAAAQADEPGPADEQAGVFGYEKDEFRLACEYALSHPDPIEWDDSIPAETEEPTPEDLEQARELAEQMVERFPDLIDAVAQFNAENPADFVTPAPGTPRAEQPEPVAQEEPVIEWSEPEAPAPNGEAVEQTEDWGDLVAEAAPCSEDDVAAGDSVVTLGFSALQGGSPVELQDAALGAVEPPCEDAAAGELLESIAQAQPVVPEPAPVEWPQEPQAEAIAAVPAVQAIASLALPIRIEGGKLYCLVADPIDQDSLRSLADVVSMAVEAMPAPIGQVVAGLRKAYGGRAAEDAREALLAPAPREGGLMGKVRGLFRRAS